MKTLVVALAVACALASFPICAEEGVALGFVTGNSYFAKNEEARASWVEGVLDGIMAENFSIKKDIKGSWLGRCTDGIPIGQIKAMFEQELQAKPEAWHAPAAFILHQRLEKFCQGRQHP